MGSDLDLSIADLLNLDGVTEVANAAVNLDLVLEELLEGADVENLVAGGLRSVDDELRDVRFWSQRTPSILWVAPTGREEIGMHTLVVTLACLPLGPDFCRKMILAYCITPQPAKRRANSKAVFKYILVVPLCRLMVAKKFNPAPIRLRWLIDGGGSVMSKTELFVYWSK